MAVGIPPSAPVFPGEVRGRQISGLPIFLKPASLQKSDFVDCGGVFRALSLQF
jgi:hypothetical protein